MPEEFYLLMHAWKRFISTHSSVEENAELAYVLFSSPWKAEETNLLAFISLCNLYWKDSRYHHLLTRYIGTDAEGFNGLASFAMYAFERIFPYKKSFISMHERNGTEYLKYLTRCIHHALVSYLKAMIPSKNQVQMMDDRYREIVQDPNIRELVGPIENEPIEFTWIRRKNADSIKEQLADALNPKQINILCWQWELAKGIPTQRLESESDANKLQLKHRLKFQIEEFLMKHSFTRSDFAWFLRIYGDRLCRENPSQKLNRLEEICQDNANPVLNRNEDQS